MRTAIIILGGLALLTVCVLAGRRFGSGEPGGATSATAIFVILWFVIAAINMWMGVARAGYTFREELPIFLLIFLVPAMAALFVRWRLS
jgi:hypothetical protein